MGKEFNPDSLSRYNGRNGSSAYVGFKGDVFDVSKSKKWKSGVHMNRHHAGQDLSTEIKSAPHGPEVLQQFSKVGELVKEEDSLSVPGVVGILIKKFPFLRRHPHPMTVHFPIALMILAPLFNFLGLVSGSKTFGTTALHCLGAGLLFTPVTIMTGYYTWWLNYGKKSMKAVTIKKSVSFSMFFLGLVLFVWQLRMPNVLNSFDLVALLYGMLLILLMLCVIVIGWFGATLTFPIED